MQCELFIFFLEVCEVPIISEGKLVTDATVAHFNDMVEVSCNTGFIPSFNEAKCTSSRHWVPAPKCEIVTCQVMHLANGFYTLNESHISEGSILSYGTRVQPQCLEGYELSDISPQICMHSGLWNVTDLECVKILCNDISSVTHEAVCEYPHLRFNETASVCYISQLFGLTNGSAEVVCAADGSLQWINYPVFGKY